MSHPIRMAECHPDRPYKAKGLCATCYKRHRDNIKRGGPPRQPTVPSCHPDRKHAGKGLCAKCYQAQWYRQNRERKAAQWQKRYAEKREEILAWQRDYYQRNKETVCARTRANHKRYYRENRDKESARKKEYYYANREKEAARHRYYAKENREKINASSRRYRQARMKSDVNFALSNRLRWRVKDLVKGRRNGSAVRDLGCSIDEFKAHIEKQFQPGMTWDNHGQDGWHLDHIVPLAWFDLTDRDQFLLAANWRNYQPLWAGENTSKNADLPERIRGSKELLGF